MAPPSGCLFERFLSSHSTARSTSNRMAEEDGQPTPPPAEEDGRSLAGNQGKTKLTAISTEPAVGFTVGAPMRRTTIKYLEEAGVISVYATQPEDLQTTPYMPWALSLKTNSITAITCRSSGTLFAILVFILTWVIITTNVSVCNAEAEDDDGNADAMDFMGWKGYDCTSMGAKNVSCSS